MTEKVVSIGGKPVTQDRKAEFLRTAGDVFDSYVETHGHEPDAVFTAFNAMNGDSYRGWLVLGAGEGYATLLMVMQHVDWMHEIGKGG